MPTASSFLITSVADPGYSRIPDPDFYPPRISDPGSQNSNKREGWKKICCHSFLFSHKFHKIEHYFSFEKLKKKFGTIFKELYNFLPQKLSLSSQTYRFGIRDPEKTYSGSRGQKGTGSRIRIRNTAHNQPFRLGRGGMHMARGGGCTGGGEGGCTCILCIPPGYATGTIPFFARWIR